MTDEYNIFSLDSFDVSKLSVGKPLANASGAGYHIHLNYAGHEGPIEIRIPVRKNLT